MRSSLRVLFSLLISVRFVDQDAVNTSGVEHEVNKATVPQLISELKLVQNGVTTAKSSIVDCMTEII